MKPKTPAWLSLLKDYWWMAGIVAGGIVLWGSLPERVKKVEAGQQSQQEEITALREWTKETQGYLKGQQALNDRLATQQEAPPIQAPEAEEVSDDGEIKVMRWTDEQGVVRTMCCQGTTCWTWHEDTKCRR